MNIVSSKDSTIKASEVARKEESNTFKDYDDMLGDNATQIANIQTIEKTGMFRIEVGCKDILLEQGYKPRLSKPFSC